MLIVIRRSKGHVVEAYGPFEDRPWVERFVRDHREMMEAWDNQYGVRFEDTYTILELVSESMALESVGVR